MTPHLHVRELFTTLPGLVVAVVGTLGSISYAVFGRSKSFQLPYETAPGLSRGLLNVLLFAPFVLCFVLITPQNAKEALVASVGGAAAAWVMYFRFGRLFANCRYTKPVPGGWFGNKIREVVVIGGTKLTSAAAAKEKNGETIQTIFASAAYDADTVWVRESRTSNQQWIEVYFYAFFLSAMILVAASAMALQALVTGVAPLDAAAILATTD